MPVTRQLVRAASKPFRRSKSKELIPEEKNMVKVGLQDCFSNPTEKKAPGSIHEILEQMKVSANSPGHITVRAYNSKQQEFFGQKLQDYKYLYMCRRKPSSSNAKAGSLAAARWRSARQIYDEFCSETSFTALNRIHKAKHMYKRIAWLVLCLGMMTWLSIQCYWLFDKYYSYPVEVKIEVKAVPKLEFPSVTICNLNPLKSDHMHEGPFAALEDYFHLDDTDSLYDEYWRDAKDHLLEDFEKPQEPPAPPPDESWTKTTVNTGPTSAPNPGPTTTNPGSSSTPGPTSPTGPAPPPTGGGSTTPLPGSTLTPVSGYSPGPTSGSTPGPITAGSISSTTTTTSDPLIDLGGFTGDNGTADLIDSTVDWSSLIKDYMKGQDFNRWKALENDTEMAEKFYQEIDESHMAKLAYANVAVKISPDELERYGHNKDDLILSCHFKGVACSPANFTHFTNFKYGNCYTFNAHDSGQDKLYSNYAGPLMGLTLELNIEQDDYIPALSPDAGIRVTIHKRGTYPFPEDEGFSVAPGYMTSVGLEVKHYTRLTPPHADCGYQGVDVDNFYIDKFGVDYTKQSCLKSCYQNAIMDTCNCAFSFYYVPSEADVCDCSANTTDCMENQCDEMLSGCNSKCPTPCDETKFSYSLSMSKWPSEQYEHHLDTKLSKTTSQFFEADERADSDDNLVKLEIYFKELIYEQMEQQKAYESQNLISDIGGQLGLWLGLSAITVGELVEFIASICKASTNKIFNRRRDSGGNGPITKVQPMIP